MAQASPAIPDVISDLGYKESHIKRICFNKRMDYFVQTALNLANNLEALTKINNHGFGPDFVSISIGQSGYKDILTERIKALAKDSVLQGLNKIMASYGFTEANMRSLFNACRGEALEEVVEYLSNDDHISRIKKFMDELEIKAQNISSLLSVCTDKIPSILDFLTTNTKISKIKKLTQETGITGTKFIILNYHLRDKIEEVSEYILGDEFITSFKKIKQEMDFSTEDILKILQRPGEKIMYLIKALSNDDNIKLINSISEKVGISKSDIAILLRYSKENLEENINTLNSHKFSEYFTDLKEKANITQDDIVRLLCLHSQRNPLEYFEQALKIKDGIIWVCNHLQDGSLSSDIVKIAKNAEYDLEEFLTEAKNHTTEDPPNLRGGADEAENIVVTDEDESISLDEEAIKNFVEEIILPSDCNEQQKSAFYEWAKADPQQYMINDIVNDARNHRMKDKYLSKLLASKNIDEAHEKLHALYDALGAKEYRGSIFDTILGFQEYGIKIRHLIKFFADENNSLEENLDCLNSIILKNLQGESTLSVVVGLFGAEEMKRFIKDSPDISVKRFHELMRIHAEYAMKVRPQNEAVKAAEEAAEAIAKEAAEKAAEDAALEALSSHSANDSNTHYGSESSSHYEPAAKRLCFRQPHDEELSWITGEGPDVANLGDFKDFTLSPEN